MVFLGTIGLLIMSGTTAHSDDPPLPTLQQIPPTWSRILIPSDRFRPALSGGQAVLDIETGLVWQRAPDAIPRDWPTAVSHCYTLEAGGRKGWRLPTIEQLASQVDPTREGPALTKPTPYRNVQKAAYWTATTVATTPSDAWFVGFEDGFVGSSIKGEEAFVWCVRGGDGYDGR